MMVEVNSLENNLYIIGIAGGSASGKTTFCTGLANALSDYKIKEFHMDDYFKPEEMRPLSEAPITEVVYLDDNHPETMNLAKMNTDIDQAIASKMFDIILIEGLLTLWEKNIYKKLDLKLFVDCQADERIVRRIRRNMQWGLQFDEISNVYLDLVRYRHNEYVEPTKWKADLIINGSNPSDKSILVIVSYIKEMIKTKM